MDIEVEYDTDDWQSSLGSHHDEGTVVEVDINASPTDGGLHGINKKSLMFGLSALTAIIVISVGAGYMSSSNKSNEPNDITKISSASMAAPWVEDNTSPVTMTRAAKGSKMMPSSTIKVTADCSSGKSEKSGKSGGKSSKSNSRLLRQQQRQLSGKSGGKSSKKSTGCSTKSSKKSKSGSGGDCDGDGASGSVCNDTCDCAGASFCLTVAKYCFVPFDLQINCSVNNTCTENDDCVGLAFCDSPDVEDCSETTSGFISGICESNSGPPVCDNDGAPGSVCNDDCDCAGACITAVKYCLVPFETQINCSVNNTCTENDDCDDPVEAFCGSPRLDDCSETISGICA